ncbi:MAG: S41 family peptidase, partial [Flavobacteriaceae bacterium]
LAQCSPLKKGDIIEYVDGKTVAEIMKEKEPYVHGSNQASKYRNLSYYVLSAVNSDKKAQVIFNRDGVEQEALVPRYGRKYFKKKNKNETYKTLVNNIGYLNLGVLKRDEVPGTMEAISATKGLIIDIRNYPKGTFYALANHLSSVTKPFYRVTRPDLEYPGKFYFGEEGTCGGLNRKWFYSNKVVLLVNEMTQSHAEFTTMALQTGDNVITIGSQTAGADGNVSSLKLAGGMKTSISGIGIFYPDGTETQRKGVKIDIQVKPTLEGIIEGKDEVLEKAIEILSE